MRSLLKIHVEVLNVSSACSGPIGFVCGKPTSILPVERRDFPHFFPGMQVLSLETQMTDGGDGMANFQGDSFVLVPLVDGSLRTYYSPLRFVIEQ